MFKIPSLSDFNPPSFDNLATTGYLHDGPAYSKREEQQQESQPLFMQLREFPFINITNEMLATRETARTIGSRDLFLPVQDSAFKKIANILREKGLLEAIRCAAFEDPREITYPLHWLATK